MGTLSENQTQEHNKEENRPGREDLGAGATSEEKAERLGASESGRDFGPVTWRQRASGLRATGPAGQQRPRHRPQGASRQVLVLTRDPVVFFQFWFLLSLVFPSPLPPPLQPGSHTETYVIGKPRDGGTLHPSLGLLK